jgi:hypothetical protein
MKRERGAQHNNPRATTTVMHRICRHSCFARSRRKRKRRKIAA